MFFQYVHLPPKCHFPWFSNNIIILYKCITCWWRFQITCSFIVLCHNCTMTIFSIKMSTGCTRHFHPTIEFYKLLKEVWIVWYWLFITHYNGQLQYKALHEFTNGSYPGIGLQIDGFTWQLNLISRLKIYSTVCATHGAGTAYPSGAPEFTPGFEWGSCYSIFSLMCMFCRSLFVLLSFFFWPLCFVFFFDLRVLITPLVSSNSSNSTVCVLEVSTSPVSTILRFYFGLFWRLLFFILLYTQSHYVSYNRTIFAVLCLNCRKFLLELKS